MADALEERGYRTRKMPAYDSSVMNALTNFGLHLNATMADSRHMARQRAALLQRIAEAIAPMSETDRLLPRSGKIVSSEVLSGLPPVVVRALEEVSGPLHVPVDDDVDSSEDGGSEEGDGMRRRVWVRIDSILPMSAGGLSDVVQRVLFGAFLETATININMRAFDVVVVLDPRDDSRYESIPPEPTPGLQRERPVVFRRDESNKLAGGKPGWTIGPLPDLAESRPSVLRGDSFGVEVVGEGDDDVASLLHHFTTYVHSMDLEHITVDAEGLWQQAYREIRTNGRDREAAQQLVNAPRIRLRFMTNMTEIRSKYAAIVRAAALLDSLVDRPADPCGAHPRVPLSTEADAALRAGMSGDGGGGGGGGGGADGRADADCANAFATFGAATCGTEAALVGRVIDAATGTGVRLRERQKEVLRWTLAAAETTHEAESYAPLVVWGPPGTGKTTTLAVSVLGTLLTLHRAGNTAPRVLIVAPTNAACDAIALRIMSMRGHFQPLANSVGASKAFARMLRLISIFRRPSSDKQLYEMCLLRNVDESRIISHQISGSSERPQPSDITLRDPTPAELALAQIVVATPSKAAWLHSVRDVTMPRFSYIFIDEAGALAVPDLARTLLHAQTALAPEPLHPLYSDANGCTCASVLRTPVVLAGDPRQLGPVIFSHAAAHAGATASAIASLSSPVTVMLNDSHRAGPVVTSCFSQRFYGGAVRSAVPRGLRFADRVVFEHVAGLHQRTPDSPSWFNLTEAKRVIQLLQQLHGGVYDGQAVPKSLTVCVVVPYLKQRKVIQDYVSSDHAIGPLVRVAGRSRYVPAAAARDATGGHIGSITIGTAETVQGHEYDVVFVSCVRTLDQSEVDMLAGRKRVATHSMTATDAVEFDLRFRIGFVASHQRANVILSRAKCITHVLCDVRVFGACPTWGPILRRFAQPILAQPEIRKAVQYLQPHIYSALLGPVAGDDADDDEVAAVGGDDGAVRRED